MKFTIGIKPTVITGYGTKNSAMSRIHSLNDCGCFYYTNTFGDAFADNIISDKINYVFGYNVEVFKRGKHRHNKHYVIYRYSFPIEMFKLLKIQIKQGPKTFKIIPKK